MLNDEADEYASLLSSFDLHFIGVSAPLEILEARERKRGDRVVGLARGQFDLVHKGGSYDLEMNTSEKLPAECAMEIIKKFNL